MSNMSYCRFQNTVSDLDDCYENMDEADEISDEEKRSRIRLINLCCQIAQDYGDEIS
jgi:hypothetical protein